MRLVGSSILLYLIDDARSNENQVNYKQGNIAFKEYLVHFVTEFVLSSINNTACGSVVVKALHYYSDGPGIDFRWCHWGFFPWLHPTEPCALRTTQPLKVSTRDFSWGKGGQASTKQTLNYNQGNIAFEEYLVHFITEFVFSSINNTAWCSVVVKALHYYSDGPGIDSRWCHWGFLPWYPRQNHVP